jgi:hypothetical protein
MKHDRCTREARAEFISLGGAILLAICTMLSAALYAAVTDRGVSPMQVVILLLLTVGAWIYFLDSSTERICLTDRSLHVSSIFSHRTVPLNELLSMTLIYQGFNLERGIETIELRRRGVKAPEQIALGPCWQRHKLEGFLRFVEQALHDPHLLAEVR